VSVRPLDAACRQRGQAMIEYIVIGGALAVAMFVFRWNNGLTGAQFLAEAVRMFFRNLTYFLSLP